MLNLYSFTVENVSSSINVVGTGLYDAVVGAMSWYPDINNVSIIEKQDLKTGDVTSIQTEALNAINTDMVNAVTSPLLLKGLRNIKGFTCFMDSFLFPLLVVDGYFKKHFLYGKTDYEDIQIAIRQIHNDILNNKDPTCRPLIPALKKYKETSYLVSGEQQDESEFLLRLMDIYHLEPTLINHRRYLGDGKTWVKVKEQDDKIAILEIVPKNKDIISIYQEDALEDFGEEGNWPKIEGKENLRYGFTTNRLLESECLVFHVNRLLSLNERDSTPVQFTQIIKDTARDITYSLVLVTNHMGGTRHGHYTSYFKNVDWFYYDDMDENVEIVDWETVRKSADSANLLIYYKV